MGKELFNISQNEPYLNPKKWLIIYKTNEAVLHNRQKNENGKSRLYYIKLGTQFYS